MTERGHYIEESVQVYLRFENGCWVVDRPTVDGSALEPVFHTGARKEACECDDHSGCERARLRADKVPLPTGQELYALLGEALTQQENTLVHDANEHHAGPTADQT